MPARGTEGEQERRTEKDDRRKEVGLAPVCRLLSGNTYGDQRGEGGGGERREERTQDEKEERCTAAAEGERMQEQKERE